jgi:hypothetical protein
LNDKLLERRLESLLGGLDSGMRDGVLEFAPDSDSPVLSLILGAGEVETYAGSGRTGGGRVILVTNLVNAAIARKQNFAGVVKANRIGRT